MLIEVVSGLLFQIIAINFQFVDLNNLGKK